MMVCLQILDGSRLIPGHLIVGQNRMEILTEAFSPSSRADSLATGLALLSVVAAALLITQLVYYWYQRRAARVLRCPEKLFQELSRAHRIPRSYRRTLKQLARARGVSDPCSLFVDPGLWVLDPSHDCKLLRKPGVRLKLQALQRILFAPKASEVNQR